MGIDLEAMRDAGKLIIEQMDAAELSPGEFSHRVRRCVDREHIRTVVIDSLNGYQAAMPEEQFLILHLHELLQYLEPAGRGDLPHGRAARDGRGHEADRRCDLPRRHRDPAALLRGLGRVRRAISVIKKRTGTHEKTIREFGIAMRA